MSTYDSKDDLKEAVVGKPGETIQQYDAANTRRFQNFTFFWQASALGLAAQAFLFTIALGDSTSRAGRIVSCVLSIFVSFASLVLMHTQRGYQQVEGRWMDIVETTVFPLEMGHNKGRIDREWMVYRNEQLLDLKSKRPYGPDPIDEKRNERHTFRDWLTQKAKPINDATFAWCVLWWVFIFSALFVIAAVWSGNSVWLNGGH